MFKVYEYVCVCVYVCAPYLSSFNYLLIIKLNKIKLN